ncbi:ABC transporter permease subunit [Natronolimnohabitans sp. A-GB9]|uniref:ABC transporter permease subunit n=1 Tax=Natronolimnohabitans sp. A-GB9 TaxID=3069757 RepID=UPI0027B56C0A|nr:ABC transporter permease subunit [Natronolimnohabitans sp. A-GB9]MDQ2050466.1 ABC transporter permease subunit [Natronolimnohabitans sp. A-GB9]
MTAILRAESRQLTRSSIVLTGLLGLLLAFVLAVFPGFAEEAELIEEAFPPVLLGLLGIEEIHTIEGFVGGYVFSIVWLLFAGIYFAYVSAGMIVDDIRTRRMDLLLSTPVSRESVVLQKVAALWVPLVALHVGLFAVLYVGIQVISETLDPATLVLAHLLTVPYLLVCAGIGIVLSVVLERVETAQAAAPALVFVLWLVDGLTHMDQDFEWIGAITPSRYFDPGAILVHEEYAFTDAGVLLAAFLVLLAIAIVVFVRRDI